MNIENLKKIKDIEKLCKVENFILTNGSAITKQDKEILIIAESDFELLQDKTIEERKQFVYQIQEENMKRELNSW